jgi:hypothetical protein
MNMKRCEKLTTLDKQLTLKTNNRTIGVHPSKNGERDETMVISYH